MKKIINKNTVLGLIVGIIISGVGVYATSYLAKDISFTPKDSTWKKSNGEDITNVKDAIDELYDKKNSQSGIVSNYPSVTKIWQSLANNINYTYTVEESGKYLVVTKNSTREINVGNITTTGEVKIEDTLQISNGSSLIKVIDAELNDTINVSLYNSGGNPANAFIVKLSNIELNEIIDSSLTNDATATITYTATSSNEKVLAISISNSTNRTSSISYTGNHLVALYNDNSINVNYAILDRGTSITPSAYGYNWGGGATYILK